MRVFVTGASGVFGHRIVDGLSNRGHTVVGLTRDERSARVVEAHGGTSVEGDLLDAGAVESAVAKADPDVVVHAATKLPPVEKPDADYWAQNDRVRVEGTKHLLAAVEDVEQFVFPGVVWVARQPDGSPFDETADRYPDRATQSAAEVEDLLDRESEERGFDATILRMGFFYGPDGRHTRTFAANLLDRSLPIVGGGVLGHTDATFSLIHADDAARAVAVAVDTGLAGLYHVVDDHPVTVAAYFETFAQLLDAPAPRRVPWWLARPLAGKDMVDFLTSPMPTTSERFQRATDWEPTYPTYEEGLQSIIEQWEADGTLAALRSEHQSTETVTVPSYREHRA